MEERLEGEYFQEELKKVLEDFEFREAQVRMMKAVREAFETSSHLMVEAGTGTGKSLAYLVPAVQHILRSDKPVIISTATIALQEQLFNKEIPLINKMWQKEIKAAIFKGRSNFVCLDRFYEKCEEQTLVDTPEIARIKEWVLSTKSGEWQEVEGRISKEFWEQVASKSESCLGYRCAHYNNCFVTRQKRESENVHIIVTNHHLFFSDLKLRVESGGNLGILPEYNEIIFDEAHHLEQRALHAFGIQFKKTSVLFWINEAKRILKQEADFDRDLIGRLERQLRKLFDDLGKLQDRSYLLEDNLPPGFSELSRTLLKVSYHIENFLGRGHLNPDRVENIANIFRQTRDSLDFILSPPPGEYVSWVELNGKNSNHILHANPLEVSWHLNEYLYKSIDICIFTSATLAVNGRFDYIKEKLGLKDCKCQIVDSPFDYKSQSAIFIPRDFPSPVESDYKKALVKGIKALIEMNGGRALVLFTSYKMMEYVYGQLQEKTCYRLLKQGQMSKKELLGIFRDDKESVLFATDSFREGIDVRGDPLTLLIMDKLPFSVPEDPLIKAKINHLNKQGKNSFLTYILPEAVLKLKQGFGRLIRHREDKGLFVIFDSRIFNMSYGKIFINSLPSTPLYKTWNDVLGTV